MNRLLVWFIGTLFTLGVLLGVVRDKEELTAKEFTSCLIISAVFWPMILGIYIQDRNR